jgi:hypothetical protein
MLMMGEIPMKALLIVESFGGCWFLKRMDIHNHCKFCEGDYRGNIKSSESDEDRILVHFGGVARSNRAGHWSVVTSTEILISAINFSISSSSS